MSTSLPVLFHHRWSLPILAELHRLHGARFVQLANSLELSRDSLTTTLNFLIEHGLIERNPGYGHPLRPEYLATRTGAAIGAPGCAFLAQVRDLGLEDVALRKWPMAVLFTIHLGAHRFAELRRGLGPITARALSQALGQLEETTLAMRECAAAPLYLPAPRGKVLITMLEPMAVVRGV